MDFSTGTFPLISIPKTVTHGRHDIGVCSFLFLRDLFFLRYSQRVYRVIGRLLVMFNETGGLTESTTRELLHIAIIESLRRLFLSLTGSPHDSYQGEEEK